MKQNRDWTKAMQDRLRDAESPLPEGGWERLAGELPRSVPSKRLGSTRWRRYAAAAAVVLVCFAAGDAFRRAQRHAGVEIPREMAAVAGAETPAAAEPAVAQAFTAPETAERPLARMRTRSVPQAMTVTADVHPFDPTTAPETPSEHPAAGTTEPESAGGQNPKSSRAASKSSARFVQPGAAADPFAEPQSKKRGRGLFGAKAGGAFAFANKGTGERPLSMMDVPLGDKGMNQLQVNFEECSYAHKQPLSFALTAGHEFPHGLSLESGVVYTLLRSEVSVPLGAGSVSQTLHLIGIPVRVNWAWLNRGGFSLYLGAGGLAEKCIAARFGEEKIQEKAVQFSAFAALGAQYRLGRHVGLYFEPEVSYYFNETTLRTSRTDSPVSFSLQLGVRFTY